MKTSSEYLAILRKFLEQNAIKYGITSIGIYGSVARDENNENSDLDVFVELQEPDPIIMGFIYEDLKNLCQCSIDLIRMRKGLNKLLSKRIEEDGIFA